jgi:hypothetical protein
MTKINDNNNKMLVESSNMCKKQTCINDTIDRHIEQIEQVEQLKQVEQVEQVEVEQLKQVETIVECEEDEYIYEYKIVIIGAAGATLELVKSKKEKIKIDHF